MDTNKILITYDALADLKKSFLAALPGGLLSALCVFAGSFPASYVELRFLAPDYLWHFFSAEATATIYTFALLLIAGIGTAFLQFHFLGSRIRTNVLLSAGLSRRQLFKNRCASALIALFSGVLLPLLVTLFINIRFFGLSGSVLKVFLLYVVSTFTVALIGYAAALFCIVLAGTTYEAAAAVPLVLSFPFVLTAFFDSCGGIFLNGYGRPSNQYSPTIFTRLYYLNPLTILGFSNDAYYPDNLLWTRFSRAFDIPAQSGLPPPSDAAILKALPVFLGWIAVCALILEISRRLLDKRRAELNGFSRRTKSLAIIFISFFALLAADAALYFLVITEIISDPYGVILFNDHPKTFAVFTFGQRMLTLCALLLPALMVLCAGLLAYFGGVRGFRRRLKLLPLSLLILVLPVVFMLGVFGWVGHIPNIDKIESVDLGGVFLPANGELYNNTPDLLRGFESDGDKTLITQLHRQLIKDLTGENTVNIQIVYTLKNGREQRRTYYSCADETLLSFTALFDSDTMEKYLYEQFGDKSAQLSDDEYLAAFKTAGLLQQGDYINSFFSVDDAYGNVVSFARAREMDWLKLGGGEVILRTPRGVYENITKRLTKESFDRLTRCLALDYADMSAKDFYTPDRQTLAELSITNFDFYDVYYDGSEPADYYFNITDNMTRTVAYLQTLGVYDLLKKTVKITKIELFDCNEEYFFRQDMASYYQQFVAKAYMRQEGSAEPKPFKVVTERAEIEALVEALRPYYLTVGQDMSYAVVTYEKSIPRTFVIKNR